MQKPFTIHDLPQTERPRERMQEYGAEALSAQELIALVLGRGIQGESVLVTAQKLLSQFGSLEHVLNASLADLQTIRGLGVAKSTQLKACLEIARRVSASQIQKTTTVMTPQDVYQVVKSRIAHHTKEHCLVLSFDVRNQLLGVDTVSIGTLDSSLIHPRETFECAIRRHASHVILCHNHPSGECTPSEDDVLVTARLMESGRILGIEVVDHVIVSKREYFSMQEQGMLAL